MSQLRTTWGGSLHLTFRLLPEPSPHLRPFLEAEGLAPATVLQRLPYESARSSSAGLGGPDPRRYRDSKQLYQTAGLMYEDDQEVVRVTSLGTATLRWLELINTKNRVILGRHAAYALAACQLRNPTGAGGRYDPSMTVFPFAFIWRAMLELDDKISSDELNRAMFKVKDEATLVTAIEQIADARSSGDPLRMGNETIAGGSKNDRIIPWISIASFGWILISDKKRGGTDRGYYRVPPETKRLLAEASRVGHRHREFPDVKTYVEYIAEAAALPRDWR